jgi:pimeloyl-ACP methyl ester carboxylesterase
MDSKVATIATNTLEVPGALLTYDIRRNDSTRDPVLLIIGSPMAASGFGALADYFPDRTVVTYDPRGSERSKRTDGATENTPEEHADDLHRLISAVSEGRPVDIFASSGGATNALALVARHPEQVRSLVAHEPPIWQILPDRTPGLAAAIDIHDTYLRSGFGAGMAKFIALVSYEGPIPADYARRPAPDPAMFGLPTADDGSRDDPLLRQNMIAASHFMPDFDRLRSSPTRIVIGVGEESARVMTGRAAMAAAERLGAKVVTFPGGHGGFLGPSEYSPGGNPEAFAKTLRRTLNES